MTKSVPFEKKFALLLAAVCAIVLAVSGQFGYQFLRGYQRDSFRQNALRAARSAASFLDVGACEKLVAAYSDRANPKIGENERKVLQRTLRAVKESGDLRTDIHFAAKSAWSDRTMVVLGTSHPKAYWGNTLTVSRAAEETLSRKISTTSGFYEDREGNWISAYAPVVSGAGKVVGVTVVHSRLDEEIRAASFAFWGIFLLVGSGMLLAAYGVGIRLGRHWLKRLRQFVSDMKRVAAGESVKDINSLFPAELAEAGQLITQMTSLKQPPSHEVAELRQQWLVAETKGDLSRRLLRDLLEKTGRAVWVVTGDEGLIVAVSEKATQLLGTNPTGRTLAEVGGFNPIVFEPVLTQYFRGPANQLSVLAQLPHRFRRETKSVALSFEPLVGANGKATALLAELEALPSLKVPPPLPPTKKVPKLLVHESGAGHHWQDSARAQEIKALILKSQEGSVDSLQLKILSLGILQSRPWVQLELLYPAASAQKFLTSLRDRVEAWGGVVDSEPLTEHREKINFILPLEN